MEFDETLRRYVMSVNDFIDKHAQPRLNGGNAGGSNGQVSSGALFHYLGVQPRPGFACSLLFSCPVLRRLRSDNVCGSVVVLSFFFTFSPIISVPPAPIKTHHTLPPLPRLFFWSTPDEADKADGS